MPVRHLKKPKIYFLIKFMNAAKTNRIFKTHDMPLAFGVSIIGRAAEYFNTQEEASAFLRGLDLGAASSNKNLRTAVEFVLSQLDPSDSKKGSQHILYSDCLHPIDDDKTVVDFLKESIQ